MRHPTVDELLLVEHTRDLLRDADMNRLADSSRAINTVALHTRAIGLLQAMARWPRGHARRRASGAIAWTIGSGEV